MNTPEKQCTRCKKVYPATKEYFHKWRNGLSSHCKACKAENRRAYYQSNIEKEQQQNKLYKQANAEKIKQYNREHYQANAEVLRANARVYYHEHRDARSEYSKKYKQNNSEKFKAARKAYYEVNREKERQSNRLWVSANRDRRRTYERSIRQTKKRLRRARKFNLPSDFTKTDHQRMMEYWDSRCVACGRKTEDGITIVPDHWIAISDNRLDNPGTVPWNMVPLCQGINGCNNSKHKKDAWEWLLRRFGQETAEIIRTRVETYFELVKR